ncbi:MAG: hypothetical protein M0O96_09540, partial [Desulforhopalus sp.]|nr:hypothetical protein [Desulforhopalus sp.]
FCDFSRRSKSIQSFNQALLALYHVDKIIKGKDIAFGESSHLRPYYIRYIHNKKNNIATGECPVFSTINWTIDWSLVGVGAGELLHHFYTKQNKIICLRIGGKWSAISRQGGVLKMLLFIDK